ncbi:DUF4145 domain-containing protein [Aeromonas salmonicida]|uniref:DUF4145 domain-containing protein n=1 Tax=Aeromonas salmonicida TaxID=645 RepID=UPI0013159828|nr:DUF4145 domain-containing protein [Aeromonas salmonicida]
MSVAVKAPSVREKAFNCPFCNAFSAQTWFNIAAERCGFNGEMPAVFNRQDLAILSTMSKPDALRVKRVAAFINGKAIFIPAGQPLGWTGLGNVYAAQCHNCEDISIWISDKLIHPVSSGVALPNEDMPDDIKADFEEARSVFVASPRASAALLRLCIQKLCIHLGETTGKIDSDIASMVKKGLSPLVQQSLDIVRVIGNESVHPGSIDLNDDRDTAEQLFTIVNIIVMQMISQPKIVNEMYAGLPVGKLKGIQQRDKTAPKK